MKQALTSCGRTTEVYTDSRLHAALQTVEIRPVQDSVPHRREQLGEVGAAEVCASLELSKRIVIGTNRVEHNVVRRIDIQLLGQVSVNLQELNTGAAGNTGRLGRLLLERGQQSLEPFE